MAHKYRCPLCGTTVHVSTLKGLYPIEFFIVHGLGKAKGFSFEKVEDLFFLEKVKDKIYLLYHRFFEIQSDVQPDVHVSMVPSLFAEGSISSTVKPLIYVKPREVSSIV